MSDEQRTTGSISSTHAASVAAGSDAGASTSSGARLPYVTPQLRRLGSVRELTLGTTGGASEFGMMAAM